MTRHIKIFAIFILAAVIAVSLASCGFSDSFLTSLGFDVHDYAGESVIAEVDKNSQEAAKITDIIKLMVCDTPQLMPFSNSREAVNAYRDIILANMLGRNYSRYSCDDAKLAEAAKLYPHMTITVLIPEKDFETVIYTNFGGSSKVTNKGGDVFTYLDKASAYTCVTVPEPISSQIEITYLVETKNTYRIKFRIHIGETVSPDYSALVIKRSDGTVYIKTLSEDK